MSSPDKKSDGKSFPLYFAFPPSSQIRSSNLSARIIALQNSPFDSTPKAKPSLPNTKKTTPIKKQSNITIASESSPKSPQGFAKPLVNYIAKNIEDVSRKIRKTPEVKKDKTFQSSAAPNYSKRLFYPTPTTRKINNPELNELYVTREKDENLDTPRPKLEISDEETTRKHENSSMRNKLFTDERIKPDEDAKEINSISAGIKKILITSADEESEKIEYNDNSKVSFEDNDRKVSFEDNDRKVSFEDNDRKVSFEDNDRKVSFEDNDRKVSFEDNDRKVSFEDNDRKVSFEDNDRKVSFEDNDTRKVSFEDKIEIIETDATDDTTRKLTPVSERLPTPKASLTEESLLHEVEDGFKIGNGDFEPGLSQRQEKNVTDKKPDTPGAIPSELESLTKRVSSLPFGLNVVLMNHIDNFVSDTIDEAIREAAKLTAKKKTVDNFLRLECGGSDANLSLSLDQIEDQTVKMEARFNNDRKCVSIILDKSKPVSGTFSSVSVNNSLVIKFGNDSLESSPSSDSVSSSTWGYHSHIGSNYELLSPVLSAVRTKHSSDSLTSVKSSGSCAVVNSSRSLLNVNSEPFYPWKRSYASTDVRIANHDSLTYASVTSSGSYDFVNSSPSFLNLNAEPFYP